jgi:fructokinase
MPVIAIGELVVDWLSTEPGEDLLHARQFHRALGGNSANVAIGLNRLGTPVRFIAKIGADVHGEYLREHLRQEGMDLSYLIVDERYPTAQCYMTTRLDGEHEYRNWPKPNAAMMLVPEELPARAFEGAQFLHATGISFIEAPRRDAIQRALNLARERNIPISFDGLFPTGMTQEAHQFVETALFQSQILKVNEHELMFWAGAPAPSTVLDAAQRVFQKYQPVALMVTQAERGSFVMSAKGVADCPPVPVECVCGVGAGDAYIAGALHALYSHYSGASLSALSNEDWKRVGTFGNVAGALATRSIDAYSGIPTADELANWLGRVPI